jgi:hypothetical protein
MQTSSFPARRLLRIGTVAALSAALVNAAIYGLGRGAGLSFVASHHGGRPDEIKLVHVVSFSLEAFVVGLVVALIATKLHRPSLRALQGLGASVALLSIAMDLTIDSAAPAKATLALMHLVVGAAYVVALEFCRATRAARSRELGDARTNGESITEIAA